MCLLLFEMKGNSTIILRRSEEKFYIPEADYFGECKNLICVLLLYRRLQELALNNACNSFKRKWKTRKHIDKNPSVKSLC